MTPSTTSDPYYDDLETRPPDVRERAQFQALQAVLRKAIAGAPAWSERLAGIDPDGVNDREALASLPVLRKSDLPPLQELAPPFGGLATRAAGTFQHVFASPGPIYEPGHTGDFWRMARVMHAAGFRPGDLVYNTFSYHFTPAGFMMEQGAHAIGCAVFPAGIGNTDLQVETIASLRPNRYAGTPSFLGILLKEGDSRGLDLSSIESGIVGGEALTGSLREQFDARGIRVLQGYGTADVGQIAYETTPGAGLVLDEDVIVELVEPGGTKPVPRGEVGEVVVTLLNPDYPMIRFGTGDLSKFLDSPSPCGRTAPRIAGWLGRADQTTKVRGMFVHPGQVQEIARRHPEVGRLRLMIGREDDRDTAVLQISPRAGQSAPTDQISETARAVLRVRAEVKVVPEDTLPDDGQHIEDIRTHD
ncbi:MAG: AMP-binding protein [Rhodospirillales bacterium]|nr:AMP-binding protein [Rhodospirillales bacterium]